MRAPASGDSENEVQGSEKAVGLELAWRPLRFDSELEKTTSKLGPLGLYLELRSSIFEHALLALAATNLVLFVASWLPASILLRVTIVLLISQRT